ncbi:MAG: preprotein translocase subunit SecE [Candidatus Doudnabacteria bacterium]|nr:preprotein translocase subunit SecE [Candidatus Doudnabacteria bacterium]
MIEFLRQVKTELFKVVWPSRSDTIRYTLTVIVFSIVVALVLGAFDYLMLQLFTAILAR